MGREALERQADHLHTRVFKEVVNAIRDAGDGLIAATDKMRDRKASIRKHRITQKVAALTDDGCALRHEIRAKIVHHHAKRIGKVGEPGRVRAERRHITHRFDKPLLKRDAARAGFCKPSGVADNGAASGLAQLRRRQ